MLLAILTVAALALAGSAYAGTPGPHAKPHGHERTIRLVEASASPDPAFLDLGAPGPSAGDQVIVTDGLEFEDGTGAFRAAGGESSIRAEEDLILVRLAG